MGMGERNYLDKLKESLVISYVTHITTFHLGVMLFSGYANHYSRERKS